MSTVVAKYWYLWQHLAVCVQSKCWLHTGSNEQTLVWSFKKVKHVVLMMDLPGFAGKPRSTSLCHDNCTQTKPSLTVLGENSVLYPKNKPSLLQLNKGTFASPWVQFMEQWDDTLKIFTLGSLGHRHSVIYFVLVAKGPPVALVLKDTHACNWCK